MTTRRFRGGGQGGSSPNKPNVRLGARARVPEREITITDVTQHATEILTDQDFVITAPADGHYFRHNGSNWVNVSAIPAGDIPEGHVTQHQAALSIGASQVTAGTFGSGTFTFDGSVVGSFLRLTNTSETLRLESISASGSPYLSFYQDGTRRAYIQFNDNPYGGAGAALKFDSEQFGIFIFQGPGSARIELDSDDATGSPFYSFRQAGTRRAFIQYNDSARALVFRSEELGVFNFDNFDGSITTLQINDFGPYLRVTGGTQDEMIRMNHGSPTGNPYLSFYQAGTARAWIRLDDAAGPSLQFRNIQAGRYSFMSSGNVEFARFQHGGVGLIVYDGDVVATV